MEHPRIDRAVAVGRKVTRSPSSRSSNCATPNDKRPTQLDTSLGCVAGHPCGAGTNGRFATGRMAAVGRRSLAHRSEQPRRTFGYLAVKRAHAYMLIAI